MGRINWTQVVVFGAVVLVVFILGITLLSFIFGGWGMMGGGGMRALSPLRLQVEGMGGWCPWCGGTGRWGGGGLMGGLFGVLFMLLGLLIPIGLLGLLILGGVWLVRNMGDTTTSPPSPTCPNCRQPVQADWRNCPYCGEAID